MTTRFNPQLLLLARQYRKLSQTQVAERAGLTQGHYSRVESGLTAEGPAPPIIERIANTLTFPAEFFYQEDGLAGLPLSVHPMNRRKASVNESTLKQVHAELNIRLMHLRRYLRAVEIDPELPRPALDPDDYSGSREVARILRRAWSVPDGPIRNLTDLCERAGIVIAWCDFEAPIDGVAMSVRDLPPCVFLNSRASADRMRYSLAHELGHVIMHRIPTNDIEDEANEFASELLVPELTFRRSLLGQKITLEWLARQKAYWGVSMASLLYKAGSLDLITRHQSEYLWKKISGLGWRLREPADTDIPYETPTVFPGLIRFHAETLQYTVDDLHRLLHVDVSDIRRMYGSHLGRQRLHIVK